MLYTVGKVQKLQRTILSDPGGCPDVIALQEQGLMRPPQDKPTLPVVDDAGHPYTLHWTRGVPLLVREGAQAIRLPPPKGATAWEGRIQAFAIVTAGGALNILNIHALSQGLAVLEGPTQQEAYLDAVITWYGMCSQVRITILVGEWNLSTCSLDRPSLTTADRRTAATLLSPTSWPLT